MEQTVAPLRLRAEDAGDLAVISSVLQDALVALPDIEYLPELKTFAFIANRFCWECAKSGGDHFERVHALVRFEDVANVTYAGIDRRQRGAFLALLAVEADGPTMTLRFAGGGAIRVEATAINCRLRDIDEPWPTALRPRHALDDQR